MSVSAESTLGITFSHLREVVAGQMGIEYPLDTTADETLVDNVVKSGLRQFYYPPAMEGVEAGYRFDFLVKLKTGDSFATGVTTLALPDDYGGGLKELYVTDSAFEPITVVDETYFKRQKQGGGTVTATSGPTIAMIYRSADAGATESERYTIEVFPTPAGTVTVDYFYDSIPDMIGTASEYPFGAQIHGETMVASCLAVTEFRENEGAKGEFYASFM